VSVNKPAALLLLFGLLLAAVTTGPATGQPAPYVLNVVTSLTGPAAFLGQTQAKTLGLLENVVNKSGGIRGRPLKVVIADDTSNPQTALQLVQRLVDEKVQIIMGPTIVPTCAAAMPLVQQRGPVMWCLTPAVFPAANSYVFAAGPTIDSAVIALIRYMRERGWKRQAVITSTDASGQSFDHGVAAAMVLPENKDVVITVHEHMNPADISVAGQIARIKASNPQVVLTLATGTPWGTIMRGLNDSGVDLPVGGGHSNAVYIQLTQYASFLPRELYFPGLASIARNSVGKGPVEDAQRAFFNEFDASGTKVDIASTGPWDPGFILVSALRKLGPEATAQQIRDYIINLHGFAGTSGIYNFSDGMQRGVTERAIVIDKWDKAKNEFIPVSRLGGYIR
jgi:branched-chain amino acid transport system substrate-binding protein